MKLLICTALMIGATTLIEHTFGADRLPTDWSDVAANWEQRASTLPRIKVTYSQSTWLATGTTPRVIEQDGTGPAYGYNETDVEMHLRTTLAIDAQRWHQQSEGETWDSSIPGGVVQRLSVEAFDLNNTKPVVYQITEGEPSFHTRRGWDHASDSTFGRLRYVFSPWALIYWPFRFIDPAVWTPHGLLVPVETADRVHLFQQAFTSQKESDSIRSLTIDTDRDWRVVRYQQRNERCQIEYAEYEPHGWWPQNWTSTIRKQDDSGVEQETHCVIEAIDFGVAVSDNEYIANFPPGTVVSDVGNELRYVRADGTTREITPGEIASQIPYERLESTAAGEFDVNSYDFPAAKGPGWQLYVTCILLGLAIVVAASQYHFSRHRSDGSTSTPSTEV